MKYKNQYYLRLNKLLTIVLFNLIVTNVNSQWNHYCNFTWNQPPIGSSSFVDAEFNSQDSGIFIYSTYTSPSSGGSVVVMKSSDAGTNWTFSNSWSGTGISSYGLFKLPQYKTYYAINNNQQSTSLDVSHDNGISWQSAGGLGYYFNGFYACDTSKYYSLYGGPTYYLLKYDNGVKHMQHAIFTTLRPSLPFFPDTSIGFLVAKTLSSPGFKFNNILKSTDGGSNWTTVFSDSTINIRKTHFIDTVTGFACGDSGLILKTSDGGINWQYLNSGTSTQLNTIYFLNEQFGFAGGDSGVIIRTIDGGQTWSFDQTGTLNNFRKIYAVNDSIVLAMTGKMYSLNINTSTSFWEIINNQSSHISIYPNPANDQITIELSGTDSNSKYEVRIFNSFMNSIYWESSMESNYYRTIDVGNFANGIYQVHIRSNDKSYNRSFIINK